MKESGMEGVSGNGGSTDGGGVARDPHPLMSGAVELHPSGGTRTSLTLLNIWTLVLKWRWLIASAAVLGLAAGAATTMLTTPRYQAVATIQIDSEPPKVEPVEDRRPFMFEDPEKYYFTQYELLKSRALAERVVRNEGLGDDEAFLNQTDHRRRQVSQGASPRVSDRPARFDQAVGLVLSGLHIDPIRSTRVVRIGYDSPDPKVAARIANAVATNFISWNLERRYEASADARRFLETRLKQTRETLEGLQRQGNDYAQKNRLIIIDGNQATNDGKGAPGQSIVAADLAALNQSLSQAITGRIEAEQRWRRASAIPASSLPEVLSSPAAQALRAQRDTMAADYQQKLRLYKPSFPSMLADKAKLDAVNQQLSTLIASIKNSLKAQYDVAVGNEGQLRSEVEQKTDQMLVSQGKRVEKGFIDTDINTSRALYDSMLASYKQIGISGVLQENNISFVDRAQVPGGYFKPQPTRNLVLFGSAGLVLGVLIALMFEQLDLSMRSPDIVEKETGLPVLGVIPLLDSSLSMMEALKDARSGIAEAYASVRAALRLSTEDGVPSSLLLTSPVAGEGKSTSVLALAAGWGRLGKRVLMVDADMRGPSLHKLLGLANATGLSNVLAGGVTASAALQTTDLPGVSFLSSGPVPPNPAELLAGSRMQTLLEEAKRVFDVVVIDAPPVIGLADAPQLAHIARGVLVVVEAARTKRDVARSAVRRLGGSRANVLGALVTKFDIRRASFAYDYAYGYGPAAYAGGGSGWPKGAKDIGRSASRGIRGLLGARRDKV